MTEEQKVLLSALSSSLFGKEFVFDKNTDFFLVADEAQKQSVLQGAFPVIKDRLEESYRENYLRRIVLALTNNTVNLEYENYALHEILSPSEIPYVIIKGLSCAVLYNNSALRKSGDIDILIHPEDMEKIAEPLKKAGYEPVDSDPRNVHITFKKAIKQNGSSVTLEVHRSLNGIPDSPRGEIIRKMLTEAVDSGVTVTSDEGVFRSPDIFHLGLILLVHTAGHLTREGMGLKQLCDWAVFVNSIERDEFISLFYDKLREVGLWNFACTMTSLCEKYLRIQGKNLSKPDDILLDELMDDILKSGTFGRKDETRLYQSSLFRDMTNESFNEKSQGQNFVKAMNRKAKALVPAAEKNKILLPIGWMAAAANQLNLIRKNERPRLNPKKLRQGAEERKDIYSKLKLFEEN